MQRTLGFCEHQRISSFCERTGKVRKEVACMFENFETEGSVPESVFTYQVCMVSRYK
jgi:hypothetical protein